jgi:hypothetical protein
MIDWDDVIEMVCPLPEKWTLATRLYVRDHAKYAFQNRYCNLVVRGGDGGDLDLSNTVWVDDNGRQSGDRFVYVRNRE